MEKRDIILYIVTGAILLLILSAFIWFEKTKSIIKQTKIKDKEPEKYRSFDVPEECKVPAGQDVNSWKEHLSHHQETLYCLEYFK